MLLFIIRYCIFYSFRQENSLDFHFFKTYFASIEKITQQIIIIFFYSFYMLLIYIHKLIKTSRFIKDIILGIYFILDFNPNQPEPNKI